jgi:arsenate reductase|tara:strand:+ start:1565 stop:1912 length:348 start_codon:yes stop_codon:yes gene_type:complete
MTVTIYHNPSCSKSRQTLEIIKKKGIKPIIIEYLKVIPTKDKIKRILTMLDYAPRDLMRKKESVYTEFNLEDSSLSDDVLINFMVKNPILIERPIIICNNKIAIGRPPEKVLDIL